jgi:hypothetical protein
MLRLLFVVTVVFMALGLSPTTVIASDIQASVINSDISEDLSQNQLDFDDVALATDSNSSFVLNYSQPNQNVSSVLLAPSALKPIRAPPHHC